MILEKLILHDFGVYGGRHEIDLVPDSPDKPIILFGGWNGRGKTTMLDAVNLALFGQRANLSNRRSGMSWDSYLRASINRGATGGALVGLSFVIDDDLESRHYDIARSWEIIGKGVREFFSVSINGVRDDILAEDWDEHVEGILPIDIAPLYFFDGEKIDKMADSVHSREVVRSALKGLLGIGVLERLEGDLKVLLRRKQDEAIGENASPELSGLEQEVQVLENRRMDVNLELATVKGQIDRNDEMLRRIETEARALGSDKWEQRAELETQRGVFLTDRGSIESSFQSIAEGAAPLKLVINLLKRTQDQMMHDEEVGIARLLLDELTARDQRLLKELPESACAVVAPFLTADINQRNLTANTPTLHAHPGQTKHLIGSLLRELAEIDSLPAQLEQLEVLDSRITDAERMLMSVPSEAQLGPILEELGKARGTRETLVQQLDALTVEIAHLNSAIDRMNDRLRRIREDEAEKNKGELESKRTREYAKRALDTVGAISQATIHRNLARIEEAILDRFNQLIGKKNLITSVHIDRDSLELQVATKDHGLVPIERLSAGERQLLATATLWGMSMVAGRSIPLVIDTPLGRLDGEHRLRLVSNYFPYASHQVIILSTDSEIVGPLYDGLKHAVSKERLISYDDELKRSSIEPGYFAESTHAS